MGSSARPAWEYLTKSKYVEGLQCHKLEWWRAHEKRAPELKKTIGQQNRIDQGIAAGEKAREYVPGGTLITHPTYDLDGKVAATRDAIARGKPVIYEAAFCAGNTYAVVDILERRGDGWNVIEVKATTRVKPEHLPDVAVQVHVLRRAGIPVAGAEIMYLNRECRYPDLANLFLRRDVTREIEAVLLGVPDEIAAQLGDLAAPAPPDVAVGEHCFAPWACPFLARCWPKVPADHVSSLYRVGRVKALDFEADGITSIRDLPSDFELNIIHERQVKAVTSGTMVVERGLRPALAQFVRPIAYLDFETVSLAIPVWNGCRPWELVPVQFSVHADRGRDLRHFEHIAEGPGDPRPALARAVVAACQGAKSVVAYYASFERDCLAHLAEHVPDLAPELGQIAERLVDLLPAVRNNVYHPDFNGSFSIKSVLPALVPSLSYKSLAVNDGETATVELQRLLFKAAAMPPAERERLRGDLLEYCKLDSWAMVQLLDRLRRLGGEQLELF